MTGDALELHDDGYATLRLDRSGSLTTVTLRRPTKGEFRQIVDARQRVHENQAALGDNVDAYVRVTREGDDSYSSVVALAIELIAGQRIEADDLPSWVDHPKAIDALVDHWVNVPLVRGTARQSNGSTPVSPDAPNTNGPSTVGRAVSIVEAAS